MIHIHILKVVLQFNFNDMKKIITLILFVISFTTFSQESNDKIVYLDSLNKETSSSDFKIKRIIKDFNLEKEEYKFTTLVK